MSLIELPFGLAGKIFRSPMPFGHFDHAEDVYEEYKRLGIEVIIMLSEEYEYRQITGRDLKNLYTEDGYDVLHFPILDFSVPSREDLEPVVERAIQLAKEGRNIVVHCHAGVGRSGIFLATMARKVLGFSGEEAIDWVRSFIPFALETTEQRLFVISG